MAKKVFKDKIIKDVAYAVAEERWLDRNTYLVVFQDMTDVDADTFHLEAEYHKDEDNIVFTRCYEDEVIDANDFVSPCFKKQIEEYILKQVGVIGENYTIMNTSVEVKLKLAIPLDMAVNEYEEYLNSLWVEVNRLVPTDKEELINKVKVLEIKV
jgi:hypothetical protein